MPVYILILGFHAKQAVALSNVTILGGAIANVVFAMHRRHPYCDRPLIAWDLILITEPIIIFGAVLGSFLNKLFPNALLEAILVLVYAYLSYSTISKAIALIHEEGGWKMLLRRRSFIQKRIRATEKETAASNVSKGIPLGEEEECGGEKKGLLNTTERGEEEVKDACTPFDYQTYGATTQELRGGKGEEENDGDDESGGVNHTDVVAVKKVSKGEESSSSSKHPS